MSKKVAGWYMVVECKKMFTTFLGSFVCLHCGFTKAFVPGWCTVCHFNVCLFPWFSTRLITTKFSKEEKGMQNTVLIWILSSEYNVAQEQWNLEM